MTKTAHGFYVYSMVFIILAATGFIGFYGYDYYSIPIEERFYSPQYNWFKPSGVFGHGLGIAGTLMIVFGVVMYMVAKKYRIFEGYIRLKYLLEFHIFLCTLGPILIIFHTSFKFGGIVSIAFWSMVAVVLSGVVGRFIYIQIPRSKEGRELSLQEAKNSQDQLFESSQAQTVHFYIVQETAENKALYKNHGPLAAFRRSMALIKVRRKLTEEKVSGKEKRALIKLIKQQWKISQRLYHMEQMQKLLKHWHIAHKPFALIMLVIAVVHVGITVALGYIWIF